MQPTASPATARTASGVDGAELADYEYELPERLIALRPAEPRDTARLLLAAQGAPLADHHVRDLPGLLAPGDRLVVNDSRVIPARLTGERMRNGVAAAIEVTLITEIAPRLWHAFAKPAKRLRAGDTVRFGGRTQPVNAEVTAREGPRVTLAFNADPLAAGIMPLPPYIAARRAPDARDLTDYQTVYADRAGSVAAPTAGLHFTNPLLAALDARGVGFTRLTLHVGPGTFMPVTADTIDAHTMYAEYGTIGPDAVAEIAQTKANGGRIIAVGTTALRLMESAAQNGSLAAFDGETQLFIRPGFRFAVADGLMTNFHLPRSTLLMLVAAFVGLDRMRAIYAHALAANYRFYSYGDASLLWRR